MDRKPPSIEVVRPITQQIEELGVHDGHHKVEGVVRVTDNDEERCLPVPKQVQLQLVVGHQLPQLPDIEGSQPCPAGDQNALCGLSGGQLVFFVLPHRKVLRVLRLQILEEQIHRVFEVLILLFGLRGVDQLQQGAEVHFVLGRLIPEIADERLVVELLRLHPEILSSLFPFSLGISDDGIHQLQNILLGSDVGKRIVVHGFPEIDGVEHLDGVAAPLQHPSALHQDRPLGVGDTVACVHLHQVRLHEKPGLARAGPADHQHVLVSCKLRVLGAAVHGEPLRLGQDDVLLRVGILIGPDIRGRSPAG